MLEKSEKLKAVTRGGWKDISERKIVLEDWDPETVGRLLEWLYTADYESPYPVEAPQSKAQVPETGAQETKVASEQVVGLPSIAPGKTESAKGSLMIYLQDVHFNKAGPKPAPSHAEAFTEWATKFKAAPKSLIFEATLLAHAKLYALADYMLLPDLQAQVFQRLKAVLLMTSGPSQFPGLGLPIPNEPVIGDIIKLIRYVYENTTKLESVEEPLRELISTFVAFNYDQFRDEGRVVRKFMEEGGEFHGDVYVKVARLQLALKKVAVKKESRK